MKAAYVSEFSIFMDHFLEEHPNVVEEQRHGWEFFWYPKPYQELLEQERQVAVPDDAYGFAWSVWHTQSPETKLH